MHFSRETLIVIKFVLKLTLFAVELCIDMA